MPMLPRSESLVDLICSEKAYCQTWTSTPKWGEQLCMLQMDCRQDEDPAQTEQSRG